MSKCGQMQLVLVGGGGHCRACLDVIERQDGFAVAGILDPALRPGERVLGYPVLGDDGRLPSLVKEGRCFLVTVGQTGAGALRQELFARILSLGGEAPVVISPLAYVSPHASIGAGTIVMHHAIVNAGATVGRNCIVNTRALVEHDVVVGDHCHVATGAVVNGGAVLEEGAFLGSGVVCRQGVRIGKESVVGCGVTVLRDVAPGSVFVGRQ